MPPPLHMASVAGAVVLLLALPAAAAAAETEGNPCRQPSEPVALGSAQWNGWGHDLDNSRYQPEPALRAADVPKLAVKWAFGYRATTAYGQPTVVDGRLFATSSSGRVYSLDARTGCTYWTYDAAAGVRTAVTVGELAQPARNTATKKSRRKKDRIKNAHIEIVKAPSAVFFGDDDGAVYALDAEHGTLLWKTRADPHPLARITGAPALYRNRLYVPVASASQATAADPNAGCCAFRGSVVALDIATGKIVWQTTMSEQDRPVRKPGPDTPQPSAGLAVDSAPTIDVARGLLYIAVGRSLGGLEQPASDAIVALDLAAGRPRWAKQVAPQDHGPAETADEFGASPILRNLRGGRQILVAGQKSGVVFGLNPDRAGEAQWQTRIGAGGAGEYAWGAAADHRSVYVAIAGADAAAGIAPGNTPVSASGDASGSASGGASGSASGGLAALDAATGRVRWMTPARAPNCTWGPHNCRAAQTQAVTAMPGTVFSGSIDGHLRAYSTIDGKIVWDFDTAKDFQTVNGVQAAGGSLDQGGPVIVNGMVYVNSGYGQTTGQPGNVLLAFSIDGQ